MEDSKLHERYFEVCKEYQKNIRESELLRSQILIGLKEGENIYSLFLKAVKAISLMTGEDVFYKLADANVKSIYGDGLGEEAPLEMMLQETQNQLDRLKAAQENALDHDSQTRISSAIKAHEQRIAHISDKLAKAAAKPTGQ